MAHMLRDCPLERGLYGNVGRVDNGFAEYPAKSLFLIGKYGVQVIIRLKRDDIGACRADTIGLPGDAGAMEDALAPTHRVVHGDTPSTNPDLNRYR